MLFVALCEEELFIIFWLIAMYYVYLIKSLKNQNKTYVGYTTDLKSRLKKHPVLKNMGFSGEVE